MNSPQTRPLPNAADKAALKAIAVTVVQTCPSLQDTAHEVASDLLKQHELHGLDPDHVYFHRFKAAQSSTKSFTGWEHIREKPYESMTLTQLVIHRFRATDQDNADLLDLYAGFYTAGPDAGNFNETNEVRLHGSDVLKAFWHIEFSTLYTSRLTAFWNAHTDDFRTLAKCNFLGKAVRALEQKQLSADDYQLIVDAVIGAFTWPVSLQMLRSTHPVGGDVRTVDIAGHTATGLLRFVDSKGRQIIYLPGESDAFQIMETEADMHWWMLQQMNEPTSRNSFLTHFPLADRHAVEQNITDLMNRLVSTWGRSDHHLINQTNQPISGDAFTWLRDATRNAMYVEASLSLTSNGDLRKKLWIGYLSAGLKVFAPMGVVGWPVALIIIGAGVASIGLNIDQAVNGKTSEERKQGVLGTIAASIETLLNLLLLVGTGPMLEVGPEVDAAEAAEMAEYTDSLAPQELPASTVGQPDLGIVDEPDITAPGIEESPSVPSNTVAPPQIPDRYLCNEMLDGLTAETEPGKFQGIYRLNGDPPYAILMNDNPYYVRYFADSEESGHWAIIDPERPNQFIYSLPVRFNGAAQWERMPALRLKGGGQCFGKECVPEEMMLDTLAPRIPDDPLIEPQPSTSRPIRLVKTQYDANASEQRELKKWAMELPETHQPTTIVPGGGLAVQDRYAAYFADKARALLQSARRFYKELKWANLPLRPQIPDIDASTTVEELILRIFRNAPGLVVGETLDRITSMRFLIENLPVFARAGVKTIYMRGLLNDFAQADLNAYFRTNIMSEELQQYLTRLGTDPSGRFNMLELVTAAREQDIRIQATECAASYRKPMPGTEIDEQMTSNHLTSDVMMADRISNGSAKWVAVTRPESTNTFRSLAGISELEGGIGLRLEEVNLGEATGVDVDPGVEVERGPFAPDDIMRGTRDTLSADLRLRMEAPPVTRGDAWVRKLLRRPAMYLFEKSAEGYTMIHRSRQGTLVHTQVQQLPNNHVSIHRPAWTQVNDIPFTSLEHLSSALSEHLGMTLQARIPN